VARERIVQLIDGLGLGGAERVLVAYAPALARLGYDVEVVVLQDRGGNPLAEPLRSAGVPVHPLLVGHLRRFDQVRGFLAGMRGLAPSLVHAHLEFASTLGALHRLRTGVPLVATLHTLEKPEGIDRDSARLWLMHKALERAADRVICLTASAERAARESGLARARIDVLANGVDLAPFDAPPARSRAEVRAAFGVPPGAPLVVCVAVLRPPKGIDRLLEAFPAVRAGAPGARLLVVGDGSERAALEARAAAPDLAGTVTFAGARDDVPDLLRAADLFVLPTLIDALPTVVIEAMAARLPVVASAVGGIPDMVRDGEEGLLVPPGDAGALAAAILRVLGDPRLGRDLAAAGRARAEEAFSLESQVGRLGSLYDRLIAARRSAA
jgi:glycosyltransferase involved in cell wall biosynthesis